MVFFSWSIWIVLAFRQGWLQGSSLFPASTFLCGGFISDFAFPSHPCLMLSLLLGLSAEKVITFPSSSTRTLELSLILDHVDLEQKEDWPNSSLWGARLVEARSTCIAFHFRMVPSGGGDWGPTYSLGSTCKWMICWGWGCICIDGKLFLICCWALYELVPAWLIIRRMN